MPLTPLMENHLRHELAVHPDGCHELPVCLHLIIIAACMTSDTDWDEEVYEQARIFLVDEIMLSCILKGAVEAGGVSEDGEITYQVTDFGRSQCAKGKEGPGRSGEQDRPEESAEG